MVGWHHRLDGHESEQTPEDREGQGKPGVPRSTRVGANGRISFLNGWVVFHCAYTDHIFFTHSSIDGHVGCFHILAVTNNAAMNIGMHVFFELVLLFSFDINPGVELLSHTAIHTHSFCEMLPYRFS